MTTSIILNALYIAILFESSLASAAAPALQALKTNASQVTVSGVSAGAFMAAQMQIARSSEIRGAALFAGGPWQCAQGSSVAALTDCMGMPEAINDELLIAELGFADLGGLVDSVENLKRARIYIYNSDHDTIVKPPMLQKNRDFWSNYVPAMNIKIEPNAHAGHGMPTLNYGIDCLRSEAPYLLNCNFDGAGAALTFLYPDKKLMRESSLQSNLSIFSQAPFGNSDQFDETGFIYTPQICRTPSAHCPVHIALHGCGMAQEDIKDEYASHGGYNEWAEGSGIIILYPQIKKSALDPQGCFDWFGYGGSNYADRGAPQIDAIMAMIHRLQQ